MSSRCSHCITLTVEGLIELAKREFEAQEFPKEAYYQHHVSFDSLEQAACGGCDLCRLILNCFLCTPGSGEPIDWPGEWDDTLGISQEGQPQTMYSIAKRLEVSDVKLAINATHLYGWQPINDVQVFDEIMVQVGPPHAEDENGSGIWGCPVLKLTISAPRDDAVHLREFRIGRYEVDPDLGSSKNHELTRRWMSDCRDLHANCLSYQFHELPTRVLDGRKADYVALSHCWGGAIFPLLTNKTLLPFTDHISIPELPANFRDAITITRELGLRFLWIDSLCIQQDSKSDWERESKKMGSVYRNSIVTISAMTSTGSREGILRPGSRTTSSYESITLRVFKDGKREQQVTVRRKDPNEEDLRYLDRNSALTARGWTLQEYILSPRHLLYGRDMVYWRCPQKFISPDGLPPGNKSPQTSYNELTKVIYADILSRPPSTPPDIEVVLRDYYELLRRITYASDKLPAFSGLAQRLHQVIGGDYIAGLWTADFRRGLLWQAEMSFCRHKTQPYRAPSWSWAVTDDIVLFQESTILASSSSSAKLLEHTVDLRAPDNPYGEIRFAKLALKALTKPFVRSRQVVSTFGNIDSIGSAKFDEPAGTEDYTYMGYPSLLRAITDGADYVLSIITGPGNETDWKADLSLVCDGKHLLMLVHTDDNTEDDSEWSNSAALCLVLRRTDHESENTYERVGYARIETPKLSWLDTWEWQDLVLV
ncbi:heterokaryon incompatibility protein [Colletotrichum incanum]|nr:heterokaryon incompatibility protein [Colletotrichum incanum]